MYSVIPNTNMWLDIPNTCGTTCTSAPVSLLFNGMSNPAFLSANLVTDSWQIYTMDSNKNYIDGISTGIIAQPPLVGKTAIILAM